MFSQGEDYKKVLKRSVRPVPYVILICLDERSGHHLFSNPYKAEAPTHKTGKLILPKFSV